MVDRETVQKILVSGCHATSGGNSQPWEFLIKDNKIVIYALPEKDHAILNFKNRGTLVAHGALLTNIEVAAHHFGLVSTINFIPKGSSALCEISFVNKEVGDTSTDLYNQIFTRTTNRRQYTNKTIPSDLIDELKQLPAKYQGVNLYLIADQKLKETISQAASTNEAIMLRNQELHRLFFQEVVWTKDEEQQRKKGLLLATLELPLPAQLIFRLIKNHRILTFLDKLISLPDKIAEENSEIFATGAVFGLITVKTTPDQEFIEAGRLLQKIWLLATAHNLYLHLNTGILFMNQRVEAGLVSPFSKEEAEIIKRSYQNITAGFKIGDETGVLLFRLGYANPPSASSYKQPPKLRTL